MVRPLTLAIAAMLCTAGADPEDGIDAGDVRAPEIRLVDQYGDEHEYTFPRDAALLITIAGQAGDKDMTPWLDALHARYDGAIDFQGIAELSNVPYLARKLARAAIRKRSKAPVLCDWSGEVSQRYGADKSEANVIVVSPEGKIVYQTNGPMTDELRQAAFDAIDALLPTADD